MAERKKWLQVRVSEDERELITELAGEYGMDDSTFIRSMIAFVDQKRPPLVIVPMGKGFAPTLAATTM